MSCCCCSPKEAGISVGGVLMIAGLVLIALNLSVILHFLLMVLIGVLAVGTTVTAIAALAAWRLHAITDAPTAHYTVGVVSDSDAIGTQAFEGEVNGRVRKALEASPPRGISYGFAEQSDGTVIPVPYQWADGSPVRPIRHSQ